MKNMNANHQHRWFRFSLRTLLLFVTIASAAFGWLGLKMGQAQRRRVAVEALERLPNTYVWYDYQIISNGHVFRECGVPPPEPPGPRWIRAILGDNFFAVVVGVSSQSPEFTDDHLRHLETLSTLKFLDLSETLVSDSGLGHLRVLNQLERLGLVACPWITDAGLAHIEGLMRIKELDLRKTAITDEALAHLEKLHSIEELWLDDTQVTDDGLVYLQDLTQLRTVGFCGSRVTDVGLDLLQGLKNLESIWVDKSLISSERREQLKRRFPNTTINNCSRNN